MHVHASGMQNAVQITHIYMYKKFSNLISAYRITPVGEYVTYCSRICNSTSITSLVSCYGYGQAPMLYQLSSPLGQYPYTCTGIFHACH